MLQSLFFYKQNEACRHEAPGKGKVLFVLQILHHIKADRFGETKILIGKLFHNILYLGFSGRG